MYRYVLNRAGVGAPFEMAGNSSPGVMIYPRVLQDAILYVITSETAEDTNLEVRDKLSGGRLTLRLPAQHAALALISKSGGTAKAKYGF